MKFKPINLRPLPKDVDLKLRTDTGMTLISVQATGEARYGNTPSDKDAIVSQRKDGDLLLLAWMGQWRTDVFLLSAKDLEKHFR